MWPEAASWDWSCQTSFHRSVPGPCTRGSPRLPRSPCLFSSPSSPRPICSRRGRRSLASGYISLHFPTARGPSCRKPEFPKYPGAGMLGLLHCVRVPHVARASLWRDVRDVCVWMCCWRWSWSRCRVLVALILMVSRSSLCSSAGSKDVCRPRSAAGVRCRRRLFCRGGHRRVCEHF